jgi:prophage maintenance system killer protein
MSNIRNLILRRGLLNAYPNLTLPPAARFLSANEIKLINARIVGPAKTHVCDEAALDAATNSPMNQWSNGQESDVNRLAAVLASNLMTAPVFPSGNKRTALLAAARFRLQNGMRLSPHASLAESNDAMVQAHNLRAKGLIDIEEFTVICGRMWIPGRNGDRENVMHGRLNVGESLSCE